jgi:hypothetical protein
MSLVPRTAQQLRDSSSYGEISQLYYRIINTAKEGWFYIEFDVKTCKSVHIINELRMLFPDTRIIEMFTYGNSTTYRANWSIDYSRIDQPQRPALPVLK